MTLFSFPPVPRFDGGGTFRMPGVGAVFGATWTEAGGGCLGSPTWVVVVALPFGRITINPFFSAGSFSASPGRMGLMTIGGSPLSERVCATAIKPIVEQQMSETIQIRIGNPRNCGDESSLPSRDFNYLPI